MSKNDNLKLRFKLKELEFEIEGNEETVKKEFENFKGFVTSDILPQINSSKDLKDNKELSANQKALELEDAEDIDSEEVKDYPVLKEIVHKDLPRNEQEWILIYAFYVSNFGKDTFNRSDIADMYESSNRKTTNTVRHLSRDLKRVLNKGYIKFINEEDYIVKPEGISQINLILEGKSTAKTTPIKNKKRNSDSSKDKASRTKSNSKGNNFKLDRNLNLRPEGKESLKDFAENYNMDSTPARILIVVYYLKEILELDDINLNHIYTGFDKLNIRVPKSLYQLVSDTKNKSGWLEFETMDNIGLSVQGRNTIKYDLKK
jgi:hypothetical protein